MLFSLFIDEAAVLPLRAIAFQVLLMLVAIALEAIILRRRLRLGYQPSIRYATILNVFASVLGWIVFLGVEPLLPPSVRTQIISYVLFGNFYPNPLAGSLGAIVVTVGLITFFLTFWVKAKGLELLTLIMGNPIVPAVAPTEKTNRFRHRRSPSGSEPASPHILAVLQANALSFSAILLLLLLRNQLGQGL